MRSIFITTIVLMLAVNPSAGQTVKLSFILILDSLDNRPSYATEQWIDSRMDFANQTLSTSGRGLKFERLSTDSIGGTANLQITADWLRVPTSQLENLEAAAEANPSGFLWREDAINIYVNEPLTGTSTARCSSPDPETDEAILFNRAATVATLLHEVGHFFNLKHTHGCGGCGGSSCAGVDCVDVTTAVSDEVEDTLPDSPCCNTIDALSTFNFGTNYSSLTSGQQGQIDAVFNNVMSYYTTRDRLTPLQLDRWVQSMFTFDNRADVVSGLPIYVDDDASCLLNLSCPLGCTGSPALEYETFICGFEQVSTQRDLIVLRDGIYDESTGSDLILDVDCLIVSDGLGSAIIK